MTNKILVVTGPTATGKTELGVRLAHELNGEVVSADSMQVYKYMDIGTAKPTDEEMDGIPHHMIDVASPFEKYSVAAYVDDAVKQVDDILARGKVPIVVGGTGLYVESLILGRDFAPREESSGIRDEISREYDEIGGEALLLKLSETDPERAKKLHPNDKKRVVRAVEAARLGKALTDHDEETRRSAPKYDAGVIVLGFEDRAKLYDRINRRVDIMLERGLEREVRQLLDMGLSRGYTSMQAIGYKEMANAIYGELSFDEAIEIIKRESRRYAKRQISWCQRYKDALRINWGENPNINEAVLNSTIFWREKL
jgi:tRNA dimethylallyltransferase